MLAVKTKDGKWHAFGVTINFLKVVPLIVIKYPQDQIQCVWCNDFVDYVEWIPATAKEVSNKLTHGQFMDEYAVPQTVHSDPTRKIGMAEEIGIGIDAAFAESDKKKGS